MSKRYNNDEIREIYELHAVRGAKSHHREIKHPTEFLIEIEKVVYRERREMAMAGVVVGILIGFGIAAIAFAIGRF